MGPLSPAEHRTVESFAAVVAGAAAVMLAIGLWARVDRIGISHLRDPGRCEASPGCPEVTTRLLVPGIILLLVGASLVTYLKYRRESRATDVGATPRRVDRTSHDLELLPRFALIGAGAAAALVYALSILP